ncbi:hypothetical protein [Paenibacillus thalictri]|uniref:Uncharacterized protein n=1 Tax=Paenibacillus thalictri TaxID=2527873 RepID=A0A4Q9DE23_9BACL|nr:hypothetical protein [Paenibacillus thalictri]TBL69686.1 hypothetical protein EYB31_35485 [Paenibacillus thalictri]
MLERSKWSDFDSTWLNRDSRALEICLAATDILIALVYLMHAGILIALVGLMHADILVALVGLMHVSVMLQRRTDMSALIWQKNRGYHF